MPRKNFNDGQFIEYADLNNLSAAIEKALHDRLFFRMFGSQENKVFDDSFYVSYVSATQVSVAAGLGFQTGDSATTEPEKRILYKATATTKTLAAAHATNPRIDIVCIKHNRANTVTESRDFKDASDDSVSAQNMTVQTDWDSDLLVVTGTPAGSPSAPATPSGYIKIATVAVPAVTGPTSQSDITDNRPILSTFAVEKSFTLANNQVAAANITGLSFDPNLYRGVTIEYDIYRKTASGSTECREIGKLILTYSTEDGAWTFERDAVATKNDTGITFSMSGNQLKYVSTNISGSSYVGNFNYRVKTWAAAA